MSAAPHMGRMLVVDDEEPILLAAREYFQSLGFAVDCASELEEAQALLSHVAYSVVIADLRLTGIYGSEGLAIVRHVRERCPQTRIVILTAYGSSALEEEARRLGVDGFLLKPKPLPDIARIVLDLLGETA